MTFVLALAVITFSSASLNAQTKAEIVSEYSDAIAMLKTNPDESITTLNGLLEKVETLEEEEDKVELKTKISEKMPVAYFQAGAYYYKRKKYEEAIVQFETAKVEADKQGNEAIAKKAGGVLPKLYLAVGQMKAKEDNLDEAISYFTKSIAAKPKSYATYYQRGLAYKKQEKSDEATADLTKAIELTKGKTEKAATINAAAKKALKGLYIGQAKAAGSADDAIALLQKASELGGSEEDASQIAYELGKAYKKKGDNSTACSSFAKVTAGPYVESAKYERDVELKCN